jgi:hypothetical protein
MARERDRLCIRIGVRTLEREREREPGKKRERVRKGE